MSNLPPFLTTSWTASWASPDVAEVVFLDSSVLLNVLNVPGKNGERDEVLDTFTQLRRAAATLVIPIAAVIEVGNHLAQLGGRERQDRGQRFADFLRASLEGRAPGWSPVRPGTRASCAPC